MKRFILLFFCFVSVVFAQEEVLSEQERKIEKTLHTSKVTLDFSEAPFMDVIRFVQLTSGINIVVDHRIIRRFEKDGTKVTLSVQNLKLKTALDLLCQFYNLAHVFRSDVLFIVDKEYINNRNFVKTYDIRSLYFPSRYIFENNRTRVLIPKLQDKAQRLKNIITSVIEPNSWKGSNRIHINDGLLMVKNKASVHREISSFLERLNELHDPIAINISLYIVDNYNAEKQSYSSRTLLYGGKVFGVENTVSFISLQKDNFDFSMALLPSVMENKGIKLRSEVICQHLQAVYRDQGVALVVNDKESIVSALPTSQKDKTLLIVTQVSTNSLRKEKNRKSTDIDSRNVENRLRNESVTMNFSEAPLFEVIEFLRTTTGINMIISPSAVEYNSKCEITVKDLRLSSVLDLILSSAYRSDLQSQSGLTYKIANGVVIIVPEDKLTKTTRCYYVADLLDRSANLFIGKEELSAHEVYEKLLALASDKDRDIIAKIGEGLLPKEVDVESRLKDLVTDKAQNFVDLCAGHLVIFGKSDFHKNVLDTLHSLRERLSKNVLIQCSLGKNRAVTRMIQNRSLCSIITKFSDDTMALKIRPTVHGNSTWLEIEYKTSSAQGSIITMVENGKSNVVADIGGQELSIIAHVSTLLDDYKQYLKTVLNEAARKFLTRDERDTQLIFAIHDQLQQLTNRWEFQKILDEEIIPVLTSRLWEEQVDLQLRILDIFSVGHKLSPQVILSLKKVVHISSPKVVNRVVGILAFYGRKTKYNKDITLFFVNLLEKKILRERAIGVLQNLLPHAKDSDWKKQAIATVMKYTNEWTEQQWYGKKEKSSGSDVWEDDKQDEEDENDYEDDEDK